MEITSFFPIGESGIVDLLDEESVTFIRQLPLKDTLDNDFSTNQGLDYVSYKVYQNQSLWWVIAIYNDILNPFDYSSTKVLRIPDITNLKYEKLRKIERSLTGM